MNVDRNEELDHRLHVIEKLVNQNHRMFEYETFFFPVHIVDIILISRNINRLRQNNVFHHLINQHNLFVDIKNKLQSTNMKNIILILDESKMFDYNDLLWFTIVD